MGVLAGREQLAEDLLEHAEVVHLLPGHGSQRLVQQQHPLLGPIGMDEAGAEVGERHELEVGVTEASRQLKRLAEARLLRDPVGFEHRAVLQDPPGFR